MKERKGWKGRLRFRHNFGDGALPDPARCAECGDPALYKSPSPNGGYLGFCKAHRRIASQLAAKRTEQNLPSAEMVLERRRKRARADKARAFAAFKHKL